MHRLRSVGQSLWAFLKETPVFIAQLAVWVAVLIVCSMLIEASLTVAIRASN